MFVSLGQGGNQLAACFWQRVEQQERGASAPSKPKPPRRADAAASVSASAGTPAPSVPRSPWIALDGYAHAVCVDAEPKVIQQMQRLGYSLAAGGGHPSSTRSAAPVTAAVTSAAITAAASSSTTPTAASSRSFFRPSNLALEQYGRGNNWAMGYFGRLGDEGAAGSLLSSTLEAIRRESERLDVFDSVVLMHSLAGGTGSGLGSRLAEEVRDAFPRVFLVSVSIAPFGSGDTPLQHYNSLMALSHLYPAVDALILASNADISRALQSMSLKKVAVSGAPGGAGPAMAFDGINTYLSAALADVLAPTKLAPTLRELDMLERRRTALIADGQATVTAPAASSSSPQLLATPSLYELVSHVAPLPAFKFMEIWSSAGMGASSAASAGVADPRVGPPPPSWRGCMDSLQRFVPKDSDDAALSATASLSFALPTPPSTLAYTAFARGDSVVDPIAGPSFDHIVSRMGKLFPPVRWNPHPMDFVVTPLPRLTWGGHSGESTRSLALCVNRSRTALSLAPSVRKARLLLNQRAYVHWYTRYGVEVEEMSQGVEAIEDVIREYAHMNVNT